MKSNLTDEQRASIKQEFTEGATVKDLAAKYDTKYNTIFKMTHPKKPGDPTKVKSTPRVKKNGNIDELNEYKEGCKALTEKIDYLEGKLVQVQVELQQKDGYIAKLTNWIAKQTVLAD